MWLKFGQADHPTTPLPPCRFTWRQGIHGRYLLSREDSQPIVHPTSDEMTYNGETQIAVNLLAIVQDAWTATKKRNDKWPSNVRVHWQVVPDVQQAESYEHRASPSDW